MTKNPHAQVLGRLGGLSRSPAKQAAARKNGKLGRKRKQVKEAKP